MSNTKEMPDMKEQAVKEQGFREGYLTCLAQIQMQLLATYSDKVLGVKKASELAALPEEDHIKLAETPIKLGVFLGLLDALREGVMQIMNGEPSTQPANQDNKTDSGVLLG